MGCRVVPLLYLSQEDAVQHEGHKWQRPSLHAVIENIEGSGLEHAAALANAVSFSRGVFWIRCRPA